MWVYCYSKCSDAPGRQRHVHKSCVCEVMCSWHLRSCRHSSFLAVTENKTFQVTLEFTVSWAHAVTPLSGHRQGNDVLANGVLGNWERGSRIKRQRAFTSGMFVPWIVLDCDSNISWRTPPISLTRENSDPTNSMDPLLSLMHALASISRVGVYDIRLGLTSIHKQGLC